MLQKTARVGRFLFVRYYLSMGRKVKKIKPGQTTLLKQGTGKHKEFWNKENKTRENLALTVNGSADQEKYQKWKECEQGGKD